ncbi:hypothetical protein NEMIN01_2211 [Nematocida minor]|uniref:uncharacterized protein n=1 Tax=Nematocida minor TaxID=1912983 RepID=UPI00221F19F6|nr:uncharacterized protein NEMIN01_2211 [Nematocida minor]KAI5192778.1 hypothetical protein NEMIN01_2211 [Nematocida minor]
MKYYCAVFILCVAIELVQTIEVRTPFFKNSSIDYEKYFLDNVCSEHVSVMEDSNSKKQGSEEEIDASTEDSEYEEEYEDDSDSFIFSRKDNTEEESESEEQQKSIESSKYTEYKRAAIEKMQMTKKGSLKIYRSPANYFWRSERYHYFGSCHAAFLSDSSLIRSSDLKSNDVQKKDFNFIRIILNDNRIARFNHRPEEQLSKINEIVSRYFSVLFFNSAERQKKEELENIFVVDSEVYAYEKKDIEQLQQSEDFIEFKGNSRIKNACYSEYVMYYEKSYKLVLENGREMEEFINHLSEMKCFCELVEISIDHLVINNYSSFSEYNYRRNDTMDRGPLVDVLFYLATIVPKKITINHSKEVPKDSESKPPAAIKNSNKKKDMWSAYGTENIFFDFDGIEITGFNSGSISEWFDYIKSLGVRKIKMFSIKDLSVISEDFINCITKGIEIENIELVDCVLSSRIQELQNRLENSNIEVFIPGKEQTLTVQYSVENALLCSEPMLSFIFAFISKLEQISGNSFDVVLCNNSILRMGDYICKNKNKNISCKRLVLNFAHREKDRTLREIQEKLVYYLLNDSTVELNANKIELVITEDSEINSAEIAEFVDDLLLFLPMIFNFDRNSIEICEKIKGKETGRYSSVLIEKNKTLVSIYKNYIQKLFKNNREAGRDESKKDNRYIEFIKSHKTELPTENNLLEKIKVLKCEMITAVTPFFLFHKQGNENIYMDQDKIDNYVGKILTNRWAMGETKSTKDEDTSYMNWIVYIDSLLNNHKKYFEDIQVFIMALHEKMKKRDFEIESIDSFSLENYIRDNAEIKEPSIHNISENYRQIKSCIEIDAIKKPIKELVEKSNINHTAIVIKVSDTNFLKLSKLNKFLYSAIEKVVQSITLPVFDPTPGLSALNS